MHIVCKKYAFMLEIIFITTHPEVLDSSYDSNSLATFFFFKLMNNTILYLTVYSYF